MMHRLVGLLALSLALVGSAQALDIQATTVPGRAPSALSNGEIAINRADGRFFYRDEAGNRAGGLLPDLDANGYLKFRNGMTLGRYQGGKFISQPDAVQIQGAGSTGDASGLSVTPTGTSANGTLASWFGDLSPALSYVPTLGAKLTLAKWLGDLPVNPRWWGAVCDGVTRSPDDTLGVRGAIATGRPVYLPGTCVVSGHIGTLLVGQSLTGDSVYTSLLMVNPAFASSGAYSLIALNEGARMGNLAIQFNQSSATSRATLIQYPWAVDIRNAPRVDLGRLRIGDAWNGISGTGNPGGMNWDYLEIGALNKGIVLDGLLDFAHGNTIQCYPFGAGTTLMISLYGDGVGTCAEFGRVDGLDVKSVTTFQQKLVFSANQTNVTDHHIGSIQLDGDNAVINMAAGNLQVGHISSTKGNLTAVPDVALSGGIFTVDTFRAIGSSASQPQFAVTGGVANIKGGSFEQTQAGAPAASVTGGTLILANTYLAPNGAQARTVPYVQQSGAGVLVANNNTANAKGSGSGALISIGQDNAGNRVSGNHFGGWGYGVPFGSYQGSYGPNRVAPFTWTPTLSFATPGDSVFTYATQLGTYWYEENGLRYAIRLGFSTNAFTTATGGLQIQMPFAPVPSTFGLPQSLGFYSKFTFNSGFTGMNAVVGGPSMTFWQYGSGQGRVQVSAGTNVPASTSGFELTVTGFIPSI